MAQPYRIGVGIHNVTDAAAGLPMLGFAVPNQFTTDVESLLMARAFAIEDATSGQRVLLVCAEIWSCSATLKREVINRLLEELGESVYTAENLMICGTHTHSGPGRYIGYRYYDLVPGGFDPHTFECVVSGIVSAAVQAHQSLAPGKVYVHTGAVDNCGLNRSLHAYENNPQSERDRYADSVDKEMLLLKFCKVDADGSEEPLGLLNWFPIHPTDRGQKNTLVCGDNKGWASQEYELLMTVDANRPFVAAFANSNAGDVTGNITVPDGVHDREHMREHGRIQMEAAQRIFAAASEELKPGLAVRHTRVDMSNQEIEGIEGARTWPPATGLAFAAGSVEDGVPVPQSFLSEGIPKSKVDVAEAIIKGLAIVGAFFKYGLRGPDVMDADAVAGHGEKPILFSLGHEEGLVPTVLSFQVIKIGQLAIAAVPGEITTMAGRRLRETILQAFQGTDVTRVVLSAYANDYCQYVTTHEEYDKQHYEGASTLYGPYSLLAYQQTYKKLSQAIVGNNQVEPGPEPLLYASPFVQRWTFRNLSSRTVRFQGFYEHDTVMWIPFMNGNKEVAGEHEVAYKAGEFGGGPVLDTIKIKLDDGSVHLVNLGDLVTIHADGTVSVGAYTPQ
ncbi:MAG: flagellar biosynthesis protein FlgM [Deltaproteobacteria bacterium]|nr:MAG: flagellar biosynthesis protein FlgM [Deltaproteobacteria bacterium]